MSEICDWCNCYPNYIDSAAIVLGTRLHTCRPCTFFEHTVCVSDVISKYQWMPENCLPACESYEFHQESVQYVGIQSKYSQNTSTLLIDLAGD